MPTILHIITGLGSGGAERQLTALVRGSTACAPDWRHVVLSLTDTGIYGPEIEAAGGCVYALGLRKGEWSLSALYSLLRVLKKIKPTVLQSWLYHADLAAIVAAPFVGFPPVVWNIRCSNMDLEHYSRLTRWVLRILKTLSRLPSAVISNSFTGLEEHIKYGYRPRYTQIIANGIDTDFFSRDIHSRSILREQWSVGPEERLLVCCARYDPMKDHAGLLHAFAEMKQPNRLVLVGRGMDRSNEALTTQIKAAGVDAARLILLGERRDIPQILSACDAFVMASAFGEGFPNAVAEAMACELSGVVTNVGDAAEILGEEGIVVPPSNPQALREAVDTLFMTGRFLSGGAARNRIINLYDVTKMTKSYLDLYKKLSFKN